MEVESDDETVSTVSLPPGSDQLQLTFHAPGWTTITVTATPDPSGPNAGAPPTTSSFTVSNGVDGLAETADNPPNLLGMIPDQHLYEGFAQTTIDLSPYFGDAEDGTWQIEVVSVDVIAGDVDPEDGKLLTYDEPVDTNLVLNLKPDLSETSRGRRRRAPVAIPTKLSSAPRTAPEAPQRRSRSSCWRRTLRLWCLSAPQSRPPKGLN